MADNTFHGVDVNKILKFKETRGYDVSIAVTKGDALETYCAGSGRYRKDFPVNPDMMFQAGSVSKPAFAVTLLRYADKGIIDLDADISDVLSDFVSAPLTFPALLLDSTCTALPVTAPSTVLFRWRKCFPARGTPRK